MKWKNVRDFTGKAKELGMYLIAQSKEYRAVELSLDARRRLNVKFLDDRDEYLLSDLSPEDVLFGPIPEPE